MTRGSSWVAPRLRSGQIALISPRAAYPPLCCCVKFLSYFNLLKVKILRTILFLFHIMPCYCSAFLMCRHTHEIQDTLQLHITKEEWNCHWIILDNIHCIALLLYTYPLLSQTIFKFISDISHSITLLWHSDILTW